MQEHFLRHVPSLLPVAKQLALAACHDVTVLLTGETGSGKTHLARLIHDCSARRDKPFVSVPCGAVPGNLLESAFFGHVHGAFTGAHRNQEGKFAAAKGGTILLDEIDTLGVEQQAGLLRVLETGEYEPVGSNQTQRCQARVMVASNWDLERAVEEGRFRKDLYFRLHVFSFRLPPLARAPAGRRAAGSPAPRPTRGPVRQAGGHDRRRGAEGPRGVPVAGQHPPAGERHPARRPLQ
jgi:transcriptional regulator with GAF, ATPase, and Fis domain